MSLVGRLDGLQRRHPSAGFPIAVLYKYIDDSGGYLAALLTYYAFLSLFPLLLLASTILGYVLSGDPAAQQAILGTALRQFPVIGQQLQDPGRIGGGLAGLLVGGLGALYGGLGVGQALQFASNTAFRVPRNSRPNPLLARGRGMLLLLVLGLAVLGTTALSTLGAVADVLGPAGKALVLALSVALNAGVLVLTFRIATPRALRVRDVVPGAIVAATVWQLLQSFGAAYVQHVVRDASATNGVFALVLGLISFLYLASVAAVLCIEINAVRVDRLYPRALLTPLTDDVELTEGDERAYAEQAKAARSKGFEQIDVHFDR